MRHSLQCKPLLERPSLMTRTLEDLLVARGINIRRETMRMPPYERLLEYQYPRWWGHSEERR